MDAAASKFPHRARSRALLVQNAEGARSQMIGADEYSRKQLEKYAQGMEQAIATLDAMREEYDPE